MVTTVRGQFRKFTVAVDFDEANPERSTVEAHIGRIEHRYGHGGSRCAPAKRGLPRCGRLSGARVRSTHIEQSGDGYRIDGDLTIRGASRPVTLDAEIGGVVPNLQGGRRAGFSASTQISRKAWGLTWNGVLESGGVLVGDDIKISIEVAAVQAEAVAPKVALSSAA